MPTMPGQFLPPLTPHLCLLYNGDYGSESGKAIMDWTTIEKAVELLLDAAPAGSKVILFGSHARGDARPDSDLDFL